MGFTGEIDHAIFSARGPGNLQMNFFGSADMIEGEKEPDPVFFFRWSNQGYQSSDKNKRENKDPFNLSFQDQTPI